MHIAHAYVLLDLARTQPTPTTTIGRYPQPVGRRATWWRRRRR